MKPGLVAIGALLVWPAHVAPAAAQPQTGAVSQPGATPPSFMQVRAGPWSFTPLIRLVDIGVDTNVLDASGNVREAPDFTTTIEPQFEARMRTSSLDLKMTARVGLVYYQTNTDQRSVNPGGAVSVEQRLSSFLSVHGSAGVGYSKERTEFEVDARTRHLSQDERAGVRVTGRKLDVDVEGSHSGTQYDSGIVYLGVPLDQTLNRTVTGMTARLSYRLSPYTSLTASASASAQRFPNAIERNIDLTRESVGFQFGPRAVIGGSVELGYLVGKTLSAQTPSFSGLAPRAGLSFRFFDTTAVAVGVQRDLEPSYTLTSPYFVYNLYEASVRQAILHRFDVGASAQYATLDYRRFASAGVGGLGPSDRVRELSASVGFRVARGSRVGYYVEHWQRTSVEQPYNTLRTGVMFSVGNVNASPRGVFLNTPGR